jgi:hypothetical protein
MNRINYKNTYSPVRENSFSRKIEKFLQKVSAIWHRLNSYDRGIVEYNEDGFALMWDRWPILKPKCQKKVRWEDVCKIDVYQQPAFIGEFIGLFFIQKNEKNTGICVVDTRKGYEDFFNYVSKRFSGFNLHNYKEIENFYETNINLPCWNKYKLIDDLEVNSSGIVWKKNGNKFEGEN